MLRFRLRNVLVPLLVLIPAGIGVSWLGAVLSDLQADRAENDRQSHALSRMKMLCVAAMTYAEKHGGKLPSADSWEDELRPYMGERFEYVTPPTPSGKQPRRFAMNKNLSGRNVYKLDAPSHTVLFFESVAEGPNAADELGSLPGPKDGGNGYAIGYADGHASIHPHGWNKQMVNHPYHGNKVLSAQ